MERNNGVTAIIYLASVRSGTLQPYFRSGTTDAIFHSLTTFTFTQILRELNTCPSQDTQPRCVLPRGCLQRTAQKEEEAKAGTRGMGGCRFLEHLRSPGVAIQRLETIHEEWVTARNVSSMHRGWVYAIGWVISTRPEVWHCLTVQRQVAVYGRLDTML